MATAPCWELQRALNHHLMTTAGAASHLREVLARIERERTVQSNPQSDHRVMATPVLLDAADHERLASDMARFTDLLVDLPGRLYDHDLERMCHDIGLLEVETAAICAAGSATPVVFGRCDLFATKRGWRLVEVGVGGGTGLAHIGDLNRLLLADTLLGGFLRERRLGFRDPLDTFASDLRRACRAAGIRARPMVGVVDWTRYYGECITFLERYAAALGRAGFDAEPCHVRQLVRRDGRLHLGDKPVDALVMNYLLEDLSQDPDDIEAILACQVDGSVLSAMTFYGDLVGSKGAFALVWRALEEGRLSSAEAGLVRHYVPETRIVEHGWLRMLGVQGAVSDVLAALRPRLVLKPTIGSEGTGVVLGAACDNDTWAAAGRRAVASSHRYVAQEFLEPAYVELPEVGAEGDVELRERSVMLSVYVAGGELAGYMVRCGPPRAAVVLNMETGAEVGAVFHPTA